jgi:hypothetical protein
MHVDARPFGESLRGEDLQHFGYGMSMPRTQRQEAVEIMQDVLLEYNKWIDSGKKGQYCDNRITNWIHWLHKVFIPKLNI